MATRGTADGPVLYSLIDRLIDDKDQDRDRPRSRNYSIEFFKRTVRRDLEWLLNSRMPQEPAEGKETARSLFNYGLPDISSLSMASSNDRDILKKAILAAVQRFEPRILNPVVTLLQRDENKLPELHFIIEGHLRVDPNPEPVAFDTVLDLASGEYRLPGDQSAR